MDTNNPPLKDSKLSEDTSKNKLTGKARSLANLKPHRKGEPTPNPYGRPKGVTFEETFRRHLELVPKASELKNLQKIFPQINLQGLTARDLMCIRAITKGISGDDRCLDIIMKRLEGLPKQSIKITQENANRQYSISNDFLPEGESKK